MKKQKSIYRCVRYQGLAIQAKREIPYEIKLSSQLLLDDLCFHKNKERLAKAIDHTIESGDKQEFIRLSKIYKKYLLK